MCGFESDHFSPSNSNAALVEWQQECGPMHLCLRRLGHGLFGIFCGVQETLLWALRLSIRSSVVSSFCIAYSWFRKFWPHPLYAWPLFPHPPPQTLLPFSSWGCRDLGTLGDFLEGTRLVSGMLQIKGTCPPNPPGAQCWHRTDGAEGCVPCCSDSKACRVAEGQQHLDGRTRSAVYS